MRAVRSAAAACVLVLGLAACGDDAPAPPATVVHLDVAGVAVRARVAATASERRRGLAGVERLAPDEGLLLVWPGARRASIWMKGCRIPLDVAFVDPSGRIVAVHTLQPPASPSESPARAEAPVPVAHVLEVSAGFFARHGLGPGDRVTWSRLPRAR